MELTTRLNRARFSWMTTDLKRQDRPVVLVRVTATLPDGVEDVPTEKLPTSLVVVLDRSGSMHGAPLDEAKRAICSVVDRLSPGDTFGLVTFDNGVDVVVPAGPVTDKAGLRRRIMAVETGGSTDLCAGLVRGLEEARRLESAHGVRVLLVSDGHANAGITDPEALGARAHTLLAQRITTSTLGMGLAYDEVLLSAIARAGSGNEYFAAEADTAAGFIAQECGELLAQRFLSCRLTVRPGSGMRAIDVINEATSWSVPDGIEIDLGGMTLDETRSLVLELAPNPATRPGRRKVATIRLDYVLADDLSDHHTSTTVWTNVIRPDERPGALDREVVGEWFMQRVLRRKRRAMKALATGDRAKARRSFELVQRLAVEATKHVSKAHRLELQAEIDEVERLIDVVEMGAPDSIAFASKAMSMDVQRRSRRRQ